MPKNTPSTPLGYLLIIAIFLPSLLLLIGASKEWRVREYLRQHGVSVRATIVERSEELRSFSVEYSFMVTTPGGEGITVTQWESTDLFWYTKNLKYSDSVLILYDPANPNVSRLAGNSSFTAAGLFAMAGIATTVYLAVGLTSDLLKLHKETNKLDTDE